MNTRISVELDLEKERNEISSEIKISGLQKGEEKGREVQEQISS